MKKICYYQFFKPVNPDFSVRNGGNCHICIPDKDNKKCGGYLPITITTFLVKEEKDELDAERS